MAINATSNRANLSSEFLRENWEVPDMLRNDYVSIGQDSETLFGNDVQLDARLTIAEGKITAIEVRLTAVEVLSDSNEGRLDLLEPRVDDVEVLAGDNKDRLDVVEPIVTQNTSDITDINDGRYSPQFDTHTDPNTLVTSNNNQTYYDISTPATPVQWVNPTIGVNTGWVQL